MVVQDDDDPDIAVAVDRVAGKSPHVFQKPGLVVSRSLPGPATL